MPNFFNGGFWTMLALVAIVYWPVVVGYLITLTLLAVARFLLPLPTSMRAFVRIVWVLALWCGVVLVAVASFFAALSADWS